MHWIANWGIFSHVWENLYRLAKAKVPLKYIKFLDLFCGKHMSIVIILLWMQQKSYLHFGRLQPMLPFVFHFLLFFIVLFVLYRLIQSVSWNKWYKSWVLNYRGELGYV